MLACEVSTNDEASYNSAISTCKKNQQCPETYRAAERQCVRSSNLKPAEAQIAHLKPKDAKGELSAQKAPDATHLKPKDMNEEFAAENTIEHAEMKMTEKSENKHDCFFDYNALEDDDEFVDAGGILNVSEQDKSTK